MGRTHTDKRVLFNQLLLVSTVFLLPVFLMFVIPEEAHAFDVSSPQLSVVELRYDPYPAEPGKYLNLWVKIENDGDMKASNVSCILLPEFPFALKPGEDAERNIGILHVGESAVLQYELIVDNNAIGGWNELGIKCTSQGDVWIERKIKVYVEAESPEIVITSLQSTPNKILAGSENNQLKISLTNVGDGNAEAVVAVLHLPEGFEQSYSYSNLVGIGRLNAGESKEAVFYIDVDDSVKPGSHKAVLEVRYIEENDNSRDYKSINLSVNIDVAQGPKPEIVGYETQPEVLAQGEDGKLILTIKNMGQEKAESVSVKIIKNPQIPLSFENKYDYVGTLEAGESGTAVFTFSVDPNAELKTYQIKAQIRYLADEEVKTKEFNLGINVGREDKRKQKMIYASFTLLVIIAIAAYLMKKRR